MALFDDLPRPLLSLAPMAGYTESAFRRLVKSYEPTVILTSELLSAKALCHGSEKTKQLMQFSAEESPYYGVQIFGDDAESMVQAGHIVAQEGADFVDLNLGCPSPKVVGSGYGSALLKNPQSTADLIATLVQKVPLPITVKMRLGFYDDAQVVEISQSFAQAGISSLAIHGRTAQQRFSGQAAWEPIYKVKKALQKYAIPVFGNGDITSLAIAQQKLKTLDGLMIGRAAMRRPWIFAQCRAAWSGKPIPADPPVEERVKNWLQHAQWAIEQYGEIAGLRRLRKYFAQSLRGIPHASQFRDQLIRIDSFDQLQNITDQLLTHQS